LAQIGKILIFGAFAFTLSAERIMWHLKGETALNGLF
jgi:hypothetical protein